MEINTNSKKIEEVLTKKVVQVLPGKSKLKRLMRARRIRLYLGVDPTGTNLHLGHTITLRKLQEFAELGHEAILVVGSGTVLAGGDPSARDRARSLITEREIKKNIATWKKQARKILDLSRVKVKYNGDWLLKLDLKKIIQIASNISAIKLFQRDMFQERLKRGGTVWAHETLYPLLQGYDSVALDTDLEIGGTDQLFNMLIGRELQQKMRHKEKFVLTVPLVLGTDGKPMSKTSGNCVWLTDSADQMFGKLMSIPDNLIISYFTFLTDLPPELIRRHKRELQSKKINPAILKRQLAFEIVKMYHSRGEAKKAEEEFNRIFREKRPPSEIPEIRIKEKALNILELLMRTKLALSKAEAKRLIMQKGVKIDGEIQGDWQKTVKIKKGQIVQVGKRKFIRLI
jgi:tyrosyl-tRNA synthetase